MPMELKFLRETMIKLVSLAWSMPEHLGPRQQPDY